MKTFVIYWDYADSFLRDFESDKEAEQFISEKLATGYASVDSFEVFSGEVRKVDIQHIKDLKYSVTIS